MKRFFTLRRAVWLLFVLLTGWLLAGFLTAMAVTYPAQEDIAERDSIAGFEVKDVSLVSSDSTMLSAWLVPNGSSAVILLAGIRGNRTSNIARAELYLKRGYTVLLPDLRGTGESGGEVISFGWNERSDLAACYAFLKMKGYDKIAVHGVSLGAATIAYSFNDKPQYDFVVMESSYDNIDNAFRNRIKRMLPKFMLWPAYFFTEWRIGAGSEDLCPAECVKQCTAPVLYMAGDEEEQVRLEETKEIFANIGSDDKELFIFKGGKHQDFLRGFEKDYTSTLNKFLDRHETGTR
jgi:uncharacterized protein